MWAELTQILGTMIIIVVGLITLHTLFLNRFLPKEPAKQDTTKVLETAVSAVEDGIAFMEDVKFNLSVGSLIKALLNDPKCREEIYTAVREGAGPATIPLGGSENYLMFVETSKDRPPGADNYIQRNNANKVIISLKVQGRVPVVGRGPQDLQDAIQNNPDAARKILTHLGYK